MHFSHHVSGIFFVEASGSTPVADIYSRQELVDRTASLKATALNRYLAGFRNLDTSFGLDFRDYFALVLLLQPTSRSKPNVLNAQSSCGPFFHITRNASTSQGLVEKICNHFEKTLLSRAPEKDQWHLGKTSFRQKVAYFVENRTEVRFCLPAFPCKSSNPAKVASVWPDGAEFEALTNLHQFCADMKTFYPPGCKIEVVSDGHVFSDCVGVDDGHVSQYNQKLVTMSEVIREQLSIERGRKDRNPVTFHGLYDILFGNDSTRMFFNSSFAKTHSLKHPVNTRISHRDEICRGLLLQTCSTCSDYIHQKIQSDPQSSLTTLYRGFSRFMLDDLQSHPDGQNKSKSQRKKLAETVALEMMQRNQAYSHLVELVMPRHVRLSIHAHDNSGPKFAISLLPKDKFRPLTSFDGVNLLSEDDQYDEKHHLHIPTPWHNALVEVEGHKVTYVCKAGLVRSELAKDKSIWSVSSGYISEHERGGRFVLRRNTSTERSTDS